MSCFVLGCLGVSPSEADEDYSGTYILLQQSTVAINLLVTEVVNHSRVVSLHQVRHRTKRLKGDGRTCLMTLDSDSKVLQTTIKESFKKAMPTVHLDARLRKRRGRIELHQGKETILLGAKLRWPNWGSLPSKKDDERVIDHDQDGNPGVTAYVKGIVSGKLFFTQRIKSWFDGYRRGDGFFGQIGFVSEIKVLGASNIALKTSVATDPVPEKSYFRLQRVPATTTCQQAIELAKNW
ncbi:MAG: hypothetical protein MK135_02700 [Polyangiaceae bacterium]|nr:hypothetical protein [Polyangiaceae bacterium]